MEIRIESQGPDRTVMKVVGRLDAATSPAFEQKLTAWFEQGAKALVLDLDQVEYVSSAGLRVLLFAAKKMKAAQGALALSGLSAQVREVFEISGFDSIFSIFENAADAAAHVERLIGAQEP